MKKSIKFIAIIVFLCGLAALVVALGRSNSNSTTPVNIPTTNARAFRVVYMTTFQPADGSPLKTFARSVRLQKSDGSWRETTTDYDLKGGEVQTVRYAINGRGLFAVLETEKKLKYISHRPEVIPAFNEEAFKKSPLYQGEGEVLGYRTIIMRETVGKEYEEFQYAPALNGLIVKRTAAYENGTNFFEATKIEIDGFTENDFGTMPEYPIDYGSYQKSIDATRDTNPAAAKEMEKNLPK
ncbi:MAG TPA: hypothetical protein VGC76_11250 [Pyrinomonadaceae bacterium]|jgi:hypothetical protein